MSSLSIHEMKKNAQKASKLLKHLAHPARLLIVCQLCQHNCCAGDLQRLTHMSQTALSQHLAILRRAKIVRYQRRHRHLFYELYHLEIKTIIQALKKVYCD